LHITKFATLAMIKVFSSAKASWIYFVAHIST